ncbi:M20/M25/M40 family metallo-hydrolase [Cyclobacterium jeungdonense]|uniref:M28 family peptidase n=1 Tax=Cyclobacterium jeungdonense TaxID=708087 RepID=A0ABT8C899_9BACT|nr:M20/M25/M40 family metallo-hydrolase [Cyclobacterium jeungdonense]MDN3689019.1 M28 family peptidase [Cyclobacterium jeungdonense]
MKTITPLILLLFWAGPWVVSAQDIDQNILIEDIRTLSSDAMEGRAPMTAGSEKAGTYIRDRFESLGLSSQFPDFSQQFILEPDLGEEGMGVNILGFIPGTTTSEIILVLAHYDHLGKKGEVIYNGADDNASGTAAMLQMAAYFAENTPRHSMIFVATDAEEKGLLGARALIRDFPFSLNDIKVVVNMDMISRSEDQTLYAVGTRFYPEFRPFLEEAAGMSSIRLVLGNDGGPGEKDWSRASDHGPFHEKGVPFIYFGVEDHKDYHQPTDTFENIQQEFYTEACELILDTLIGIDQSINE